MVRGDVIRGRWDVDVSGIAGCTGKAAELTFRDGLESGLGDWQSDAAIWPAVIWKADTTDYVDEIAVEVGAR